MKRNNCSIVQDLLPLYIEDMLRPDTVAYVEDHLSDCSICTTALGDLKPAAVSPAPILDAEEAHQADQQVLKGLKKSLTMRNVFLGLTALYALLHFFPWMAPQWQGIFTYPLLLLCLVFFPLYLAVAMFFRQEPLSRNTAVAVSIAIFPVAGLPLYLFISAFYNSLHDALYGHNGTGLYPYETLWEWFTATFFPALFPVILCGILLTTISLRKIWCNAVPSQIASSARMRRLHILAFCLSGLILILNCIPWALILQYRSYVLCPLDFDYMFNAWIPLCVTTAVAFWEVSSRKQGIFATILALALPSYLYYYFLSPYGTARILYWNTPDPYWVYPFSPLLLLGLYCLLAATSIFSVWYKLKHQPKQE